MILKNFKKFQKSVKKQLTMYIGKWYYSQAVTWTARKQNFVEEKFEKN